MALKDNPLKILLAIVASAFAISAFAAGNVELFGNELANYRKESAFGLIGTLVVAYLISDRQYGNLTNGETLAIGLPMVSVLGMRYVDSVNEFILAHEPISQGALIVLAAGAVAILSE